MISEYLIYATAIGSTALILFLSFFYTVRGRNCFLISGYSVLSCALFLSIYLLLGKPTFPNFTTQLVYADIDKAKLLFFHLKEGEAIYLLLDVPSSPVPIYLKLPWNTKTAEKLQQLGTNAPGPSNDSGGNGEEKDITVSKPFSPSLETRPNDFKHSPPPKRTPIQKPKPTQRMVPIE